MVRTCCWVLNGKNRECKSGKILLYKFPHVNLHFSKEYQHNNYKKRDVELGCYLQ